LYTFEFSNNGEIDPKWATFGMFVYYNFQTKFSEYFSWNIPWYSLREKQYISDHTHLWEENNGIISKCLVLNDSFMLFAMRTPKAASTTMEELVIQLSAKNRYVVSMVTTLSPFSKILLPDDYTHRGKEFMKYFTSLHRRTVHVAHLKYLPFREYGYPQPIYIGTLRDPIERVISHYNYDNFGDRPMHPKHDNTYASTIGKTAITFEDCVRLSMSNVTRIPGTNQTVYRFQSGRSCLSTKYLNVQLRYYCSMVDVRCKVTNPNNELELKYAYEKALRNIKNEFAVIVITEQMSTYIQLLEKVVPHFFKGIYHTYANSGSSGLRSNSNNKITKQHRRLIDTGDQSTINSTSLLSATSSTPKKSSNLPKEVRNYLSDVLKYEIMLYEETKKLMAARSIACNIPVE
jgi:hypothetical protein